MAASDKLTQEGVEGALIYLAQQVGGHAAQEQVQSILHPDQYVDGTTERQPVEPEEPPITGRPATNASTQEWQAFRKSQGYTDDQLDGFSRNELRDDLPDDPDDYDEEE